ncbi:MAG: lipoyltransferase, partial [Duncaniella sp.]|nr:lipoyltransferase [Duncaniella sp.]
MKYIELPFHDIQPLSFYLAEEEFVARHLAEDDCFFMWQVNPSVIFGRNQLIEKEVNLDYCRAKGIGIYRRKSGGGCVYADLNNIMFSYICDGQNVPETFDRYIGIVTDALRALGVDACPSGRNDIMIADRKVSGNAFYHIPGRNIVHGTMLYDTDMDNMVRSITPSDEKIVSKGVESVRQHITLLKDYIDLDIEAFKRHIRSTLCDSTITLTDANVETIRDIEREYLSPGFIYGNNPRYTLSKRARIEGCGDIEARLELKNGVIKSIDLVGDYFLTGDLDGSLLPRLRNVPLSAGDLARALEGIDVGEYIRN